MSALRCIQMHLTREHSCTILCLMEGPQPHTMPRDLLTTWLTSALKYGRAPAAELVGLAEAAGYNKAILWRSKAPRSSQGNRAVQHDWKPGFGRGVYNCESCSCWTANLPSYKDEVCDAKERRFRIASLSVLVESDRRKS